MSKTLRVFVDGVEAPRWTCTGGTIWFNVALPRRKPMDLQNGRPFLGRAFLRSRLLVWRRLALGCFWISLGLVGVGLYLLVRYHSFWKYP
jgi:hypothetical protein